MFNQSNLRTLSFAAGSADGKIDLWPDTAGLGSAAADNALGRDRADELVTYMRDHDAPMVLGFVVQAMIARGRFGAIEVGFHNQVSLHAMAGAGSRNVAFESSEQMRSGAMIVGGGRPDLRLVQTASG
jgi:hypothetical protein